MLAFVVEKDFDGNLISSVKELPKPICEDDEIIIKTSYSSINYKDALSFTGNSGVTKKFPHITGIDVAGTVYESKSNIFKVGQRVVVTGYDFGMNTNGGHCEFVKVPANWVAKIPDSMSEKEIMIYGTAGLTASLCINEILNHNILTEDSNILVTGSTGGVGSIAVKILSNLGFNVTALTSKKSQTYYLQQLGAKEIIYKDDFLLDIKKPLLSQKYSAVIDSVGGDILSQAIKQTKYDGIVTCCGLTLSYELNTNVFPFILRGVRLVGIDSVECSLDKKQRAWEKLAGKYRIKELDKIAKEITLYDIKEIYEKLLKAQCTGRYVVKIA